MNVVVLTGSLGADPKLVKKNGVESLRVSIATNEFFSENGEKKQKTDWHRLVFSEHLVEVALKYLKKGSTITLRGKYRSAESENKTFHYVQVLEFQMCGSKN